MKRVKTAVLTSHPGRMQINLNLSTLVDVLVTTGPSQMTNPVWDGVFWNLREELNNA
jgi:hypothetical protein